MRKWENDVSCTALTSRWRSERCLDWHERMVIRDRRSFQRTPPTVYPWSDQVTRNQRDDRSIDRKSDPSITWRKSRKQSCSVSLSILAMLIFEAKTKPKQCIRDLFCLSAHLRIASDPDSFVRVLPWTRLSLLDWQWSSLASWRCVCMLINMWFGRVESKEKRRREGWMSNRVIRAEFSIASISESSECTLNDPHLDFE